MCGIAGIVTRGLPPDVHRLDAMIRSLRHRGPDGNGSVIVDNVGLAHTRLAIMDLDSTGAQPMCHSERPCWITYNGELFNHSQIRRDLPPFEYQSNGDTATALNALVQSGADTLRKWNGFFALGFLDADKRRLLLARDRFGVKPLYYAATENEFLFASEINALLAAGVPRHIDDESLRFFLGWAWAQGRGTPMSAIKRLPPGCMLEIDLDTLVFKETTWSPLHQMFEPAYAGELASLSEDERISELERCLHSSVERRLLSDITVGTMCSGGIDSSLITAIAAQKRDSLPAFVASYPDQPRLDETRFAREVALLSGAELFEVPMNAAGWRQEFVSAIHCFGYPLWHESSIALALIASEARRQGVNVLLGGDGADEIFGGYDYKHLPERSRFAQEANLPSSQSTADESTWVHDQRIDQLFSAPQTIAFDSDYRIELMEDLRFAFNGDSNGRHELERVLARELRTFLTVSLRRNDAATMRYAVEYREPYLDNELVRFGLNSPLEARVSPIVKGDLRRLAAKILPPSITQRKKLGFSFDSSHYILGRTKLEFLERGMLRDYLHVPKEAWLDVVQNAKGRTVMRLASAEIWFRLFANGDQVSAVERDFWID